ncbi:MAG: MFS transporter [Candidatus Dormibacteria bacterium]
MDLEVEHPAPGVDVGAEYRWRILSSALLVQVTISVVTQAFPALAPFAKSDLGLSTAEVGIFATILNLGTFVALLPAGWAVDVLGERRVLVVGGVVTGLLTLVASLAPRFVVLVPLLILVGLAAATPTPAGSTAVISSFAPRDRGFVMSLRQTGIPIGGATAALVLPPVAVAFGWRKALMIAAMLAIAGAIGGRFIVRRAPRRPFAGTSRRPGSLRTVAAGNATYLGLASVFLGLGQFALASYIALYLLTAFGMPLTVGSLFLVAANLGGILGRLMWGGVSDRVFGGRRKGPLIVVSLSAALGFLLLGWLPGTTPRPFLLALIVGLGATVIGWNGIYVTLLSEIAPPDKRGRSVAYGMMLTQVGIFAGPVTFGIVVQLTDSYRVAWTAVAGSLLISAALLRQVREPPRDQGPVTAQRRPAVDPPAPFS